MREIGVIGVGRGASVAKALESIIDEREAQFNKWGEQNHEPPYWLGILGEEFGELCEAVNESSLPNADKRHLGGIENMRKEAIHVAAVAVAFIECLDRHKEPEVEERVYRICSNCAYRNDTGEACLSCNFPEKSNFLEKR